MKRSRAAVSLCMTVLLISAVSIFDVRTVYAGKISFSMKDSGLTTEMEKYVKEIELFDFFVEHINDFIRLPQDIKIVIEPCDEANAYYDPETKQITMCTELFDYFYELAESIDEENAGDLFYDVMLFTALHEFGHALVDIFDLPITGQEENVVDQLATWVNLETIGEDDEEGMASPLAAAYFFAEEAEKASGTEDEMAFWDSHPLDPQRFYNIICWIYGYNPKVAESVMDEKIQNVLPEERQESCEEEYRKINQAFIHLLKAHLIDPPEE